MAGTERSGASGRGAGFRPGDVPPAGGGGVGFRAAVRGEEASPGGTETQAWVRLFLPSPFLVCKTVLLDGGQEEKGQPTTQYR